MKITALEDSNKLAGSVDHGIMLLPDLAKEIEVKLEDNSSSTRTQINLKPNSTRIETPLAQLGAWISLPEALISLPQGS